MNASIGSPRTGLSWRVGFGVVTRLPWRCHSPLSLTAAIRPAVLLYDRPTRALSVQLGGAMVMCEETASEVILPSEVFSFGGQFAIT